MAKDKNEQIEDERLQQYMGRHYGQRGLTRELYYEAIQACSNILYLDKTVAEIARMYGHREQSLRNQLKRHFPQLLAERDRIRSVLGMNQYPQRGEREKTKAKYAQAIELLRTTTLTIKEVAERCGMGAHSLQQHVLFYHRDVAEQRLALRVNALDKQGLIGGIRGNGAANRPRKTTEEHYAKALELYRTTGRTSTEIAKECGVSPKGFQSYVERWWRTDMERHETLRQELVKKGRQERGVKVERKRVKAAREKYTPALKMIEEGASYEQAAEKLGVGFDNLYRWVMKYHPAVHRLEHKNHFVQLPEGTTCSRETWAMFGEAAEAYCNTDEPLKQIAERMNLRPSSLYNFLTTKFPQAVAKRRKAQQDKDNA